MSFNGVDGVMPKGGRSKHGPLSEIRRIGDKSERNGKVKWIVKDGQVVDSPSITAMQYPGKAFANRS